MTSTPYPTTSPTRRHPARGRWKTLLLTSVLVGGLLGVLLLVFRDRLRPSVAVQVGRVLLLEEDDRNAPTQSDKVSELLFQASGWIEPDPWPVRVAVLTDGFVQDVWVKEGETVTNGQLVARLDPADRTLEWREAQAHESTARAAVAAASNTIAAALTRQNMARAHVEGAEAWLEEAQDLWQRFSALSAREVAETRRIAARRALAVVKTEATAARAASAGADAALSGAESELLARRGELNAAGHRSTMAALALERTTVRSPAGGVVLRRYVDPGSKRMAAMDDPDSTTVVSLFDPARLQIRVDVPLSEAGRLRVGMPTQITTGMLPGQTFTGTVSRIVGQADLQRNTLQVKVAIHSPSERMRPEVLCRVEFRSGVGESPSEGGNGASARHSLWLPADAASGEATGEQQVWVVDPLEHTAEQRTVRLGSRRLDGYRQVMEGLRANERVVTSGQARLKAGTRVKWQAQGDTQ